ncbi:Pheophorbide a oxygenase [Halothece sp. PCC 7418]|uniref:aromatic ring-hydroxylating dioxygenase subunit alpha n=1 Tax=Halothece sp. (strain PCC 7418) TaxID=65093 RepID=UPI0002A07D98|nr:Rieske 2Fe-2S domain-containing protein [Halothece sp. PCC 7418]AFZ42803.1 Pheophorbide a oxygenase [Halothece sp. PCC 7418]
MSATFNFFQHWYPLLPVADLVSDRPISTHLLGQPIAIWKPTGSSHYRAFLDRCPHRLAPLSEGRVDPKTGHLECCYHGWQFDENGTCTKIPQAENAELLERNCEQLRATALPTCVANDLFWVWPDPDSAELAAKTPLSLSPKIDNSKGFLWSSYVRDLPYDWQTLVENIADPSHVPFAHHGVQGSRESATPIPMEIREATPERIVAQIDRNFPSTMTFEPPCRLEYAIQLGSEEKQIGLITYCIPTAPGKSRIVAQFARNFALRAKDLTPRWWEHIRLRHLVLDGDMVLLHCQEAALREEGHWKSAYMMPTNADRFVIAFRKWFENNCDQYIPWQGVGSTVAPPSPVEARREVLLDRYHQHTQICPDCQGALKRIQQLKVGTLVTTAILVFVIALLPDASRLSVGLPFCAIALFSAGIWGWLNYRLEPQFYYVDYVHAER